MPGLDMTEVAGDPQSKELLLVPNVRRYEVLPLQFPLIFQHYKRLEAAFWTAEEIDMGQDATDFAALNADEKSFLSKIVTCLICTSGQVNEQVVKQFSQIIQSTEARCYFGFQIFLENVHCEVYNLAFDAFLPKRGEETTKLFQEVDQYPYLKKRSAWMEKWVANDEDSYVQRLVALAACEFILGSGCFASILSLKKRNILPGLIHGVEKILRDQCCHSNFVCHLYSYFVSRPAQDIVKQIISEAVDIELELLTKTVPVTLIGLKLEMMKDYVQHAADCLLLKLEFPEMYGSENAFDFVNPVLPEDAKTASKATVDVDQANREEKFTTEADF